MLGLAFRTHDATAAIGRTPSLHRSDADAVSGGVRHHVGQTCVSGGGTV
jgi:hypothetical protein